MRRQLTLFLPPDESAIVNQVRQVLDPRQHALISAHVTLCRDEELVPWQTIGQRLASLGEFALSMQFGEPQVLLDGGVLMRAIKGEAQYQHLRKIILGSSAGSHDPHITLLHPRNAAGVAYDLAEMALGLAGLRVTFRTVALIEQQGVAPWSVRQEFGAVD